MPDEQVPDDLSLEQIENDAWGDPPPDATRLIATMHRLRRKPIRSLTAEDLRVLLEQQVGLDVLIPRTLTRLEQEPLLKGDYYPGDVLASVLRLQPSYWSENPAQLARLARHRIVVDAVLDLVQRRARLHCAWVAPEQVLHTGALRVRQPCTTPEPHKCQPASSSPTSATNCS